MALLRRRPSSWSYLAAFAVAGGMAFLSYAALGVALDPYNVFWRREAVPREAWVIKQFRSSKLRHLAANPGRYDTVILANSRGTANKTATLNAETGLRIFNFAASSDTPAGYALKARWLVANRPEIKRIVALFWWDQFRSAPNFGPLIVREHPSVSGESWVSWGWSFANLPAQTTRGALAHYFRSAVGMQADQAEIVHDGFDPVTGDVTVWGPAYSDFEPTDSDRREYEQRVSGDSNGSVRFHDSVMTAAGVEQLQSSLAPTPNPDQKHAVADLVSTLKAANVVLDCVIPPMPAVVVRMIPADEYDQWRAWLVKECGGAWDFSTPSAITEDRYNYFDWSHYLAHVSHAALLRVLQGPVNDNHSNFGKFLSP